MNAIRLQPAYSLTPFGAWLRSWLPVRRKHYEDIVEELRHRKMEIRELENELKDAIREFPIPLLEDEFIIEDREFSIKDRMHGLRTVSIRQERPIHFHMPADMFQLGKHGSVHYIKYFSDSFLELFGRALGLEIAKLLMRDHDERHEQPSSLQAGRGR